MKQKLIDTLDHKLAFDRPTAEAIVDAILERMSEPDVIEAMADAANEARYGADELEMSLTKDMRVAVAALNK